MIELQPRLYTYWVDASGSRSRLSVWLKQGYDLADMVSAADTFRTAISAMSEAVCIEQSIVLDYTDIDPSEPDSAISNSVTGTCIFGCTNDEYAIIPIPALNLALLADELFLDQTNPDVAAFIQFLIDGNFCNPFGESIETIESAYLQYR